MVQLLRMWLAPSAYLGSRTIIPAVLPPLERVHE
jgi:hypothetical protein